MRPFGWLKKFRSNQRGNVLVLAAATMPLFIGAAGMAVDSVQLAVWKRQLQRAADSGAFAGAYAESQTADVPGAVHNDLDENFFPLLSQPEVVEVGPSLGFNRTVRVALTAQRTVPFMSFFTSAAPTITAEATAALVDDGTFCMISLYGGTQAGINVNGNANVTLGCGMATNSRATSAVTAGGSSTITASPISAMGGLDGDSNNFIGDTTLQPYSAQQQDPFADLADPPAQSGCTPESVGPQDTATLNPGCFSSLDIKGTVTLNPGTYYVTGDIDFGSQANVTGDGVTLVMTGPNGQAGDLKINAQATLDLSAPDSGDYPGILFYRDRRASNIEIKINGGASSNLQGALYFPTSDIFFAGHAGMNVQCLQMVGQIITFRGSANISNTCPPGGASQAFQQTIIRLVG